MRKWISVGAKVGAIITARVATPAGRLAAVLPCVLCGAVLALWLGFDVASFAAPGGTQGVAQSPAQPPARSLAQTPAQTPAQSSAQSSDGRQQVDVQLVLAVDVSYSMDLDELATQREGYAEAITSREFLLALRQGLTGKVAVTYFEWAGADDQKLVMPWRLIDGPESADAVAADILKTPVRRASRTSISAALNFAVPLFDTGDFSGLRRVIDVSGDGANNHGPLVTGARDAALARGIVINGLPIMIKELSFSSMDIPSLDIYYEDCVVGGPGSFVLAIKERAKFKEAIRTKLVMEVAGVTPAPRVIKASARAPRVSCAIGEKIWQERWGGQRP